MKHAEAIEVLQRAIKWLSGEQVVKQKLDCDAMAKAIEAVKKVS